MGVAVTDGRRVAVTGAHTFLGQQLLRRLDADPRYHRVLALDVMSPELDSDVVRFEHLDLTDPNAARQLTGLLREHRIDTLVHGAFLTFPTHAGAWGHELEDVGTMHVLDACAAAGVQRIVQLSTTLVYGAKRDNPNFLTEDTRLTREDSEYLGDKVRADLQTTRFGLEHPNIAVSQLRFGPILGPTVEGLFPRYFQSPVAPRLMGYDPLMQFVHQHDALMALKLVVDHHPAPRGVFNIVGRGVLPYSTVLALLGKIPVPLPRPLARTLVRAAWTTQLGKTPPVLLAYLRYSCVADGEKAQREIGFRAEYNQKQILRDFLGPLGDEGAVDLARAGVA